MARLPLFAALQAAVGPAEQGLVGSDTPARPRGTVIWAHCANEHQLNAVKTLARRLIEDGEIVTIIPTLASPLSDDAQVSPNTRNSTRAFLDHWKPQIVLWVGGDVLSPPLLEIKRSHIPVIFVEADSEAIDQSKTPRLPGKLRAALGVFSQILTVDESSAQRLIKLGADPQIIRPLGMLEDGVTPPPYNEAERANLVKLLGTRPLWLAADVPMSELILVSQAHSHAERRAHRTLMMLVPRIAAEGAEMASTLRDAGFTVACRSADELPKDATQIYVADTADGLGLWCRLSPITYLGGSLSDGKIPDPFIPAMVGSAVLIGKKVTRCHDHLDRLVNANAAHMVTRSADMGGAVETLLATDYTAQLAHAAWDVTSHGADATNELVTLIYSYLDQAEY